LYYTACILFIALPASAQVGYRGIVQVFDEAPGTGGDTFNGIGNAVFNDLGQAAFYSNLSGQGDQSHGAWSEGPGGLSLIARKGDPVPAIPGATFDYLLPEGIDNSGTVLLRASVNGEGFWLANDEGLSVIARSFHQAPGTGGLEFGNLNGEHIEFSQSGQYAFHARLTGDGVDSSNDDSIWLGDDQGMSLLVRDGMVAPGVDGRTFTSLLEFELNEVGDVVFHGIIEQGQAFDPRRGVWASRNGGIEPVAINARPAPGTAENFELGFSPFFNLRINNHGDTAFQARLDSGDAGIWAESNGTLGLVVREGDTVPGSGGAVFESLDSLDSDIAFSDTGQTLFLAEIRGGDLGTSSREGIWAHHNGQLEQVVGHLDVVPGTGGARITLFGSGIEGFASNDLGQFAFIARLIVDSEIGVNSNNRDGLWATDTDGELHLILRSGDLIDLDPDPVTEALHLIDRDNFQDGQLSERFSINNAGQVLLHTSQGSTFGWFMATIQDLAPGDVTGDGFVGAEDLDILLANWGDAVGVRAASSGDLSGDGFVGQADLDILMANWGTGTLPGTNIPEPGSLVMLCLVGLPLLRRRR